MGPLKQLTDSCITGGKKKQTHRVFTQIHSLNIRNALFYPIVRTMPGQRATQGKVLLNT